VEGRRALERAAELGIEYVESLPERPVAPAASLDELRETLDLPLPEEPTDAVTVIEELARDVEPGLTQMGAGRYFGFVIGGAIPAAIAADWLTSAWDQNFGLALPTPAAAVVEEVAGGWLKELLGLPAHASFAFVTGCQMAHATALLAARHHVLEQVGYDVEGTASPARRRSPSSRVRSATERSTGHCASWGSARTACVPSPSTTRAGCGSRSCAPSSRARPGRRSSARRQAR
jgi:Pyridoxal-dependent decarboxylase conserved domain